MCSMYVLCVYMSAIWRNCTVWFWKGSGYPLTNRGVIKTAQMVNPMGKGLQRHIHHVNPIVIPSYPAYPYDFSIFPQFHFFPQIAGAGRAPRQQRTSSWISGNLALHSAKPSLCAWAVRNWMIHFASCYMIEGCTYMDRQKDRQIDR